MSSNYNFVPRKGSICKLNCYLMSKCWLYLVAAWVRLDEVIILHTVSLAVHLTGIFELLICCDLGLYGKMAKFVICCI